MRHGVAHRGHATPGKLVQIGTPAEIYERPASRFVADFFGDINILDGDVRSERELLIAADESTGRSAATAVRPERIVVESEAAAASTGLPRNRRRSRLSRQRHALPRSAPIRQNPARGGLEFRRSQCVSPGR